MPVQAKSKSYKKVLKKHTRDHEVYQREDFNASLDWHVTWQSPEFLQAKVDKIVSIYKYDDVKAHELYAEEKRKYGEHETFYVSFYSYEYKESDLFNSKDNWRLEMIADGQKFEPTRIERIGTVTPLTQALFPYSNRWSRHYILYFPKNNQPVNKLKLSVRGPQGSSELTW